MHTSRTLEVLGKDATPVDAQRGQEAKARVPGVRRGVRREAIARRYNTQYGVDINRIDASGGYGFLHEACVQLRGEGGDRQVAGEYFPANV